MLYVIGALGGGAISGKENTIVRYRLFDTLTNSYMLIHPDILRNILSKGIIQVANAKIQDKYVLIHSWVSKIAYGSNKRSWYDGVMNHLRGAEYKRDESCSFIVLNKKDSKYSIVQCNGGLLKISYNELEKMTQDRNVANCRLVRRENGAVAILETDVQEILTDPEFEENIATKYRVFDAKVKLLGKGNMSFDYETADKEVKLIRYTGSSTDIIIPSFITAIAEDAFKSISIKTISLNEGLKNIGRRALSPNSLNNTLESIEIPSTVQFIAPGAFLNNSKLFNKDDTLNTSKIKFRNNKALVMDQY